MKKIHEALTEILPRIIELSEDIYCHPELGFKEFRSREKVTEALSQAGIPYKDVAYTGLTATLDSGRPGPGIGLIAEFDAVPTLGHPYANKDRLRGPHLRPLCPDRRDAEPVFSH